MRIVIIGNSGSGKTQLAGALAECLDSTVIHLDHVYWEPGGFDRKRCAEEVERLIAESVNTPDWIAEGVFGELAGRYLEFADVLVWLDVDWDLCKARLERRGSESKKHLGRPQSEEGLRKLIEWASMYYDRDDMRSRSGHKRLHDEFKGIRHRYTTPDDVELLIKAAQEGGAVEALTRQ